MHLNEALNVIRHRCNKSGTCSDCSYMVDGVCEVRKTLLTNEKPKREKRKTFKKK